MAEKKTEKTVNEVVQQYVDKGLTGLSPAIRVYLERGDSDADILKNLEKNHGVKVSKAEWTEFKRNVDTLSNIYRQVKGQRILRGD